MAMVKHVLSLTEPQTEYIVSKAAELGISTAELVRRIIDRYRLEEPEQRSSEIDKDLRSEE